MAKNQMLEAKKSQRGPSAIDLALAHHMSEEGDAPLEFETDSEMMDDEYSRLRTFLEQRRNQKTSNSVFFKVNSRAIMGSKGQHLQAGAIPLFQGAALDLTNADLIGEKRFMKPPEASGVGGILVLAPQKFNQGLTLPVSSLKMKENFVDGEIQLNNRSGFHGNHVRLTAEKIHITMDEAEFVNPQMVYKTKEEESMVPIPEKVAITKDGFAPTFLSETLRIAAPTQNAAETTDEQQATPETLEEMVNEEMAANEPDHIVFQAGEGRFCTKPNVRPRMKMTKYDGFSVQWKDGNLVAIISVGSKEYELELEASEAYHTYFSDSITIEAKDSFGLINGILSEMGVSGVETDDSDLCYYGLEITEKGIFYTSLKNSALTTKIGDDWELKIGNTTSLEYSSNLLGNDDEDDGSYYDLAKTILQYIGVIKQDEEEGENEEEAEEGDNHFNLNIPFFTFPLIPGLLSVDAKFAAGAAIGYKVGGSVNNLMGMLKKQQTETFGLDLSAALTGNAYAGFQVGITAGLSFFMNISGNIGAKIALSGSEDGNNVLSAKVQTEFKKNRYGRPSLEKAVFDALGELRLRAIIDASLNAEILGWEKTLYSYTFKDWELAAIQAEIMATREKQNGKGKWSADASLSYRALSGKVNKTLDNKDELEKMIHKQEHSYGQAAFDASQSSFEDAKRMLYEYQNKNTPMFVSTDASNSGFLDMNKLIQNIQHRFYIQLRTNRETIAVEMEELEKLKQDKDYQKLGSKIQSKINQHTSNLQNIAKALEINQNSGGNASTSILRGLAAIGSDSPSEKIMGAYVAGGGREDRFHSYLREKSKREAVTVDSLISYEENRRKELSQKSEERIQQLRAFAASLGIAETDDTKGDVLLPKYKSLGGKAVNKALFTDVASLRRYEESRILEKHSKWFSMTGSRYQGHQERLDALAAKFPEIVQNGSDVPNAAFYNYYTETLFARGFRDHLDAHSNRERLLAYERNALSKKIGSSKHGSQALQKREEMRELFALGVRDQQQQEQLDTLISAGISGMTQDEKASYMTATKEDFIQALEQKQKALALKQIIGQKKKDSKTNKNKTWLYDAMKLDLTIDDLIAYEQTRAALYPQGKQRQSHEKRLRFLNQKKTEADALRQTDVEAAEKVIYNTIQIYFGMRKNEGQTTAASPDFNHGKGFQKDVLRRVEEEDISVQKLFQSGKWMPEESGDLRALREDQGSIYELVRKYGIKHGSAVKHEKNIQILDQYLQTQGPKEYSSEDLDRYYTYQIHRATSATIHSSRKADHATILETLEGISDYPQMLKKYREMGRGRRFLEHEQEDAENWVTPNMILQYERNRMHMLDQKHWDRIDALKQAESGTEEDQAQALKEYAESAKRFHAKGSNETVKISLQDIINAEIARQEIKLSVHDQRIAQLRSTDAEMTDEVKINAYDGSRFEPSKEDVDRIYSQHEQRLASNPESMAEELTSFETQEKEKQEEMYKQWKQVQTDITDKLIILAEQAKQCLEVVHNTENAINDPGSVFENESSTKAYIENVLEKTENDMQQVPEVIKTTNQ